MLIQELRVKLERRLAQRLALRLALSLAQRLVDLVQPKAGLQDAKLRKELVLLRVRSHIGAGQARPDGSHQLVTVAVARNLVARQRVNTEPAVLDFIQRQQDTSDNQRLILVFQRAICTQILVKLSSVLENLLRRLLNISGLFQNVSRVILVDVSR